MVNRAGQEQSPEMTSPELTAAQSTVSGHKGLKYRSVPHSEVLHEADVGWTSANSLT